MVYKRRNTMANKAARKIQRRFRKRYVQRRGGLRFGKMARDLAYLKSAVNSERKVVTTDITVNPTVTDPTLTRINTPDDQGSSSTKRVGYKVRFTHLSGKLRVNHQNFGDRTANATVIMHVIWLKNGEYQSDFESQFASLMLNPDLNNAYSPLCYFNKTKYDSWISTWKAKIVCKDLVPVNQVALGLPNSGTSSNANETNLGKGSQLKAYYVNINKKISVHTEWNNTLSTSGDTDEITRYVPYLFCYTDSTGTSIPTGTDLPNNLGEDRVVVQGRIRLSYVDN